MPFSDITTQRRLVTAIMQNPNDFTLRLIYADWLEQNGYDKQAERVRSAVKRGIVYKEGDASIRYILGDC